MQTELERLRSGDKKVVLEFYRTYAPKILKYLKNKLARHEDANEILNDVFLDALDQLPFLKKDSNLQSFLYTLAHHKMVDFYRKKKIKSVLFSQIPYLEFAEKEINEPEFQMEKDRIREKIEKAFGLLSERYKEVLSLHYERGVRVKEIALRLNLTHKAAESLLFRARTVFRKHYERA